MKEKTEKTVSKQSKAVARASSARQVKEKSGVQFEDRRPAVVAQRELAGKADSSPQAGRIAQLQAIANGSAAEAIQRQGLEDEELLQGKFETIQKQEEEEELQMKSETIQRQGPEEEEPLQGKFETVQKQEEEELLQGKFETIQRRGAEEEEELLQGKFETIQKQPEEEELLQGKFETIQRQGPEEEEIQAKSATVQKKDEKTTNNTGLPDTLKSGIENLSGLSLDDVKVHYNSPKPAQLQAHAFAQGGDIHMAPGQEKHLPHEAWHVVQQKQGRVKPTKQMKGQVNVNDDAGLEKEADVMGARALNSGAGETTELVSADVANTAAQLLGDDEYEAMQNQRNIERHAQISADSGPITAEERGPSAADGFMTGDGKLPDTDVADNATFNNVTKGADATTAVSGSIGIADVMGAGLAAGLGVAENLPGINLATNVVGVVESGVRGRAAHRRAGVMGAARGGADDRARDVLALGEKEQSRETKRRVVRGGGGAVQSGLAIGGIAAGAATGGAGLLVVAGIIGSMKAAETFYNLYRKHKGKELSEMHAQQLLFAAQAGDESVIAALKELGVQTKELANPKVWESAVKRLASMMSVATSEFNKEGTYRDPSIVRRS